MAEIKTIGVLTIDDGVRGTQWSVGFATALTVVTEALDRLQPTAASHPRRAAVRGHHRGEIRRSERCAGSQARGLGIHPGDQRARKRD